MAVAAGAAALITAACSADSQRAATSQGGGAQRTYFIAADPVVWENAPDGKNRVTGEAFGEDENVFVARADDRIGSSYLKCVYRGYTDGTFRKLRERPASEEYLGFLGPVIRAEVGETIKVVFRTPSRLLCTRTGCSTTRTARARRTPTAPAVGTNPTTRYPRRARTPTSGGCPTGPARARWMAAPLRGCTTLTPTRSATCTPGCRASSPLPRAG